VIRRAVVLFAAVIVGACVAQPAVDAEPDVARIVMGGDVMLGRAVGAIAERDPQGIFAEIEFELATADLAMVNLESPLTERPPVSGVQYDLRADPTVAGLLAGAGIDLASVANNHAGDGGRAGVLDTVTALMDAGVGQVGGGANADEARSPFIRAVGGTTIGVLAFDATGVGPEAGRTTPGMARWDDTASPLLVAQLRERVDVLVVSIHGGAEYLPTTDASMRRIVTSLAEIDVDVVWGHGPHVVHDVTVLDPDGDGRPTVAASSLGNLVFDQTRVGTDHGALLEVMAGAEGVAAYRIGETTIADGTASFSSWLPPAGPAVLAQGSWWALTAEPPLPELTEVEIDDFPQGDVVSAAAGDIDLDGEAELVVSFRRPFRSAPLNELLGEVQWSDASGRSAHVGVFERDGRTSVWVASAVVRPVSRIAACDGAVAVSYSTLDDDATTGTGGWRWSVFGWDEAPDLEGDRSIGCLDVDGDDLREPVVGSPSGDTT
jgi:poly-gamma-glutamate synthesis protein (capsule biosynthesis protein)